MFTSSLSPPERSPFIVTKNYLSTFLSKGLTISAMQINLVPSGRNVQKMSLAIRKVNIFDMPDLSE